MGASPWEVVHSQFSNRVGFGGHTESYYDETGQFQVRWIPEEQVVGVPYNILVPGYHTKMVNTLRLWRARAPQEFDLRTFNAGDYVNAVQQQIASETISKVLYPNDQTPQGKELRLRQQYFFVACSIQDIFRFLPSGFDLRNLPKRYVFQLNDTHPTVAVAEMMRFLMDERHVPWMVAWDITSKMFGYTSHTLLPEALETWPVDIFGKLLPRHMEIIYEINRRFVEDVRKVWPGDEARVARMSIIGDGDQTACAYGASGHRRQLLRQRCGAAAIAPAEGAHAQGLLGDVAEEIRQCHQRRDAAPLHRAGESASGRADQLEDWRRLAGGYLPAGRDRAVRERSAVPGRLAQGQDGEQGRSLGHAASDYRSRAFRRRPCSTCWSSGFISTSANC